MKKTMTTAALKKALEAGHAITIITADGWAEIEYTQSANEDGTKWFWVKVQDDSEDGCWERQDSWKATLEYLKALDAKFETATIN